MPLPSQRVLAGTAMASISSQRLKVTRGRLEHPRAVQLQRGVNLLDSCS